MQSKKCYGSKRWNFPYHGRTVHFATFERFCFILTFLRNVITFDSDLKINLRIFQMVYLFWLTLFFKYFIDEKYCHLLARLFSKQIVRLHPNTYINTYIVCRIVHHSHHRIMSAVHLHCVSWYRRNNNTQQQNPIHKMSMTIVWHIKDDVTSLSNVNLDDVAARNACFIWNANINM